MTYKHGNWYCKPASKEEAKEIIERAVASGAVDIFNWNAEVAPFGVSGGVVWWDKVYGTEYTIEQVRELFPLPGERERWVEGAMHRIEKCVRQVTPECAYAAGAIYDAIKSGVIKTPGDQG